MKTIVESSLTKLFTIPPLTSSSNFGLGVHKGRKGKKTATAAVIIYFVDYLQLFFSNPTRYEYRIHYYYVHYKIRMVNTIFSIWISFSNSAMCNLRKAYPWLDFCMNIYNKRPGCFDRNLDF